MKHITTLCAALAFAASTARAAQPVFHAAPIALPSAQPPPTTTLSLVPAGDPPASLTLATDRPGFGDTTTIVPAWHFVLETGYTYTLRDRDGVRSQQHNAPEVLARLGVLEDRLELRLSTSGYIWSRSDSGSGYETAQGFSDLSIGLKLKLSDQDGALPRLCVEGMTTVGLGANNVSNRDLEPTIKLIGSWNLGSGFSLATNAIATYATSSGERFVQGAGSASLGYSVSDSVLVFGEYFVVGPRGKSTDAAHSVDFGGAWLITPRVQVDMRLGFGINNQADNFFVGAGVSILLW